MSELSGQVTHLEWSVTPLWWIPLLPFVGAATNAIFGRRLQKSDAGRELGKKLHIGSFGVSAVAVGAMVAAFALVAINVAKLVQLDAGQRYLFSHAWQMVRIGSLDVSFSFAMDPLAAVMALIITGVGALIHVYACTYMESEPSYWRFFTYLNLFVAAMLLLVLGDNFVVMFFGWEGVGLCSYLLIGFWYKDYANASAGMKAFVVNRIGDWGFICGLGLLFWGMGGAWLEQTGYRPDYRARFVIADAEPYVEGEAAAQADDATSAAAPGASGASGTAGSFGPRGAAGGRGPKGAPTSRRPSTPQAPQAPQTTEAGASFKSPSTRGYLTMTTHPGAKVYVGVTDALILALGKAPEPFAISPFVRKEVAATIQNITIVPGNGAVVAGDGVEAALIEHVDIQGGDEKVIEAIGPTVTFRELHDQLALSDHAHGAFLKTALQEKTVWGGMSLVTLSCLLLFFGATGKSAQIPLYVWLPDAMAGPTPVSALIHAATMVTAGVYMIARLSFLFSLSPNACGVIALVGAVTALFAATIGFFQYDLKKVLAYSTISQLGFMFMGVGVGAYWAGVFHLVTHAFFKACLFLAAGSVIHGMHAIEHDEAAVQDMRNMGGLRRVMPKTARAYQIACVAITAAPVPFLAGFWSKDEILWRAFTTESTGFMPGIVIYVIGLCAAFCTSFYMWRSYYLTFEGPHARKDIAKKVHESPAIITGVLGVLALLSAIAGVALGFSKHFLGEAHGEPLLEEWLAPVFAMGKPHLKPQSFGLEIGLMALAVGGAIGVWALARRRYGAGRSADWARDEEKLPGFFVLQNKYFVDEIYQATVVRGLLGVRYVFADMDTKVVDGIVNGVGAVARTVAWANDTIDRVFVDGAVNLVAKVVLAAGEKLRGMQSGRIQRYVSVLLAGVALLAIVRYFLK